MSTKNDDYRISGRVVDQATGSPMTGLRVQAWDQDVLGDDRLGEATIGADGSFKIRFPVEAFRDVFEQRPDVFFRVYQGMDLVASTHDAVLWDAENPLTGVVIEVDLPKAPSRQGAG